MGNVNKLMDAGIIAAGAALSQEDHDMINSLTADEVSALISVKSKLTPDFVQKNLKGESMGIVF